MSTPEPEIRDRPAAPLLAGLERQCFPDPWDEPALARLLANPHVSAWSLHDEEGRPCGLLLFQRVGEEAEVHRIGIVPPCRRRGWGRFLLRRFLDHCRRAGIARVVLEVRPSNLPARRLYAALGFTHLGSRPGYYRDPPEDSLVLERRWPPKARPVDAGPGAGS